MAINEAYNVDCIEYMRSLPDKYFDLAVCDPPYGSGNDTKLGGAKGSEEYSTGTVKWNRLKGGWAEKYYSPQKLGGAERFGERFRRYFKPEQETNLGGGITGSYMGCCPSSAIFR